MKLRQFGPIALAATIGWVQPAFSHAILMDSLPKLAGQVIAGKQGITLRFNSLIDVARSRVMLIGPDEGSEKLLLSGGGNGDTIHADVTLRPGHYILRWQVLAIDGHITRGDVPFDATSATAR